MTTTLGPRPHVTDPTGLTTGRWTVHREVLITINGIAAAWVWRAAPEAARGVPQEILTHQQRDFTTHQAALEFAIEKAEGNLR